MLFVVVVVLVVLVVLVVGGVQHVDCVTFPAPSFFGRWQGTWEHLALRSIRAHSRTWRVRAALRRRAEMDA